MSGISMSLRLLRAAGLGAVVLLGVAGVAGADETFKQTAAYALPATNVEGGAVKPLTSFDISYVDNQAGVYLLADRSNSSVDLLDLNFNVVNVISPGNTSCSFFNINSSPYCAFAGLRTDPNQGAINDNSGPNGTMTVNNREIWAGDAPTFSGPITAFPGCDSSTLTGLAACATGYYTVDDCDSSVKVIDIRTQQVTDVISTGGCFRADEMAFDPADQIAVVANDAEQDIGNPDFVTLISTKSGHEIISQITFDGTNGTPNATGGIEQPLYDPNTGLFYVAVPSDGGTFVAPSSVGAVAVINPKHPFKVAKIFAVNNCTPNGLALGPDNELMLGCNAKAPVQVINVLNGKLIASVPQLNGGCDEVWYNPGDNHFLGACSQGATASPYYVAGVIDADDNDLPHGGIVWDQNITTKPTSTSGASPHSIAADAYTNRILVPLGNGNPLCGAATGCIAAFRSSADDPSVFAQESSEDK